MPPAPSPAQVRALYDNLLQTSNRFASYNFRNYFARRTRETFAPVLSRLDGATAEASSSTAGGGHADLAKFYDDQSKELAVLRRAADVNRMFEGPKLVVEHAQPITSGCHGRRKAGARMC